jgi:hypothetical protein
VAEDHRAQHRKKGVVAGFSAVVGQKRIAGAPLSALVGFGKESLAASDDGKLKFDWKLCGR